MKASEDLFNLIHSLTKAEKRYFRLFSQRSTSDGMATYLRLFDAIEAQEHYDEKALKTLFAGEAFIRQLTYTKNYLSEHILKALRNYNAERSVSSQLKNLLLNVEILYAKGLYTHCRKAISQARSLAEQYERDNELVEIIRWESDILWIEKRYAEYEEFTASSYKEMQRVLQRIQHAEELRHCKDDAELVLMKGGIRNQTEFLDKLAHLESHPLLKQMPDNLRTSAKINFHQTKLFLASVRADKQGIFRHSKEIVGLMECLPHLVEEYSEAYIAVLLKHLSASYNTREEQEAEATLLKINNVALGLNSQLRKELELLVFYLVHIYRLDSYATSGQKKAGIEIANTVEQALETMPTLRKTHRITLIFACAVSRILAAQYEHAAKLLSNILSDEQQIVVMNIYSDARILHILVHYELGNDDILESLTRSAQRYLTNNKRFNTFEGVIIRFFKKLSRVDKDTERQTLFASLRAELLPLYNDEYERHAFSHFHYIAWAESKLSGTEMAEILRKQHEEKEEITSGK